MGNVHRNTFKIAQQGLDMVNKDFPAVGQFTVTIHWDDSSSTRYRNQSNRLASAALMIALAKAGRALTGFYNIERHATFAYRYIVAPDTREPEIVEVSIWRDR